MINGMLRACIVVSKLIIGPIYIFKQVSMRKASDAKHKEVLRKSDYSNGDACIPIICMMESPIPMKQ
jgi:hypothetical protein